MYIFIGIILIFLLAILIIPIKYKILVCWRDESAILKADISILVYIMGIPLRKKIKKNDKTDSKKEREKKEKNEQPFKISIKEKLLFLEKDFLFFILKTFKDIIQEIVPYKYIVSGVVGFQDPYYTGLLAGTLAILPQIDIEPDFTREIYDIDIVLEGKVVPVKIIYLGLKALFSKETRPVLRVLINSKKKQIKTKFCATS